MKIFIENISNKFKNIQLKLNINIVINILEVLSNMMILLFIYFSLLGDVGMFMSDYYLNNNISMYEIVRNVIIIGSICYICCLAIRWGIFHKRFKLEIRDLLASYLICLAEINYWVYFSETNNYIGIYILAFGVLISIMKRIVIFFLERKTKNCEEGEDNIMENKNKKTEVNNQIKEIKKLIIEKEFSKAKYESFKLSEAIVPNKNNSDPYFKLECVNFISNIIMKECDKENKEKLDIDYILDNFEVLSEDVMCANERVKATVKAEVLTILKSLK